MSAPNSAAVYWHIVDPALGFYTEAAGHHQSYNLALAECLRSRGQEYHFYGHRAMQRVDGIEAKRITGAFRYCHLESTSRFGRLGVRLRILFYLFDLLRLPRLNQSATALYFFHTVILDQLVAILLWLLLRPPQPADKGSGI